MVKSNLKELLTLKPPPHWRSHALHEVQILQIDWWNIFKRLKKITFFIQFRQKKVFKIVIIQTFWWLYKWGINSRSLCILKINTDKLRPSTFPYGEGVDSKSPIWKSGISFTFFEKFPVEFGRFFNIFPPLRMLTFKLN